MTNPLLFLALLTSPATLDQLHDTGCVPVTWPEVGENTVTYRGAGPEACADRSATLVYDRADGTILTELVDLGVGRYRVDPARLGCGRAQVDLFVGDVRDEIASGVFNPAHRLITVNWLEGLVCAPPVVTTFATTPAPSPTFPTATTTPLPPVTGTTPELAGTVPPPTTPPSVGGGTTTTTAAATVCPAGSYLTVRFSEFPANGVGFAQVELNGEPVQVSSVIPVWRAVFPFTAETSVTVTRVEGVATVGCDVPAVELVASPPLLPVTGGGLRVVAVGGLTVLAGVLLVGLVRLRRAARVWR